MDFHVIAGVTAPIIIAFHASFKFRGIAGVAFWIMLAVALSGVIGRYLYAQIPRSLNAAELSLSELHLSEQELSDALLGQSIYSAEQLSRALHVPSAEHIRRIGPLRAVGEMIVLDVGLPFRVAGLRRASSGFGAKLRSLGGLLSSGNPEVEVVVRLVRQKSFLLQARRLPRPDAEGLSSLACHPSAIQLCICRSCHHSHCRCLGARLCEHGVPLEDGHTSYLADCRQRAGLLPGSLLARTQAFGSALVEVDGQVSELPNDFVWILAGGTPPSDFLKAAGIAFGTTTTENLATK